VEVGRKSNPKSEHEASVRGRDAENPAQIPKLGWRDILLRTKDSISEHQVATLAGATAFYLLLGLIPGLAALISIYGLMANPADIQAQFAAIAQLMPEEARKLLEQQMSAIAAQHRTAGVAAAISVIMAIWSASAGMKTLMVALNITYGEKEKRSYLKQTLVALGLTFGAIVLGMMSVGLIVALPALLQHLGIGDTARSVSTALRWPLLLATAIVGLAVLYRFGPSRQEPEWRWTSSGAVTATLLWVAGSAGFSYYASHFGNYNKTYGSLAAVVVLMTWLYISAFVVLLGAEINAETEHQTAKDTTTGKPEPIGRRGAYVADTVGEKR
jgi:membrane protein